MKRLFISLPMYGRTDEEIQQNMLRIHQNLAEALNEEVELINTFIEDAPKSAKPLWYLGESIKLMADADIVYFAYDWEHCRRCQVEHKCAVAYGYDCMYE